METLDESNGKAIPFITYNTTLQKFEFNTECEKLIKEISGEFSVISVVGMYRSGKSYLLNKMIMSYKKGFCVGKTINACTKGLWIWSKPILGQNSEGKTIPVLLIDTEGFGSSDSDYGHDTKIFTLAVLLSSLFIYNSVGVIDENVLDSLGFICNMGKLIGSKTIKNSNNNSNNNINSNKNNNNISPNKVLLTESDIINAETNIIDDIFPSLLWILRDFTLQLQDDDGSNFSSTAYLEKVLNYRKKSSGNINIEFDPNNNNNKSDIDISSSQDRELVNNNKESVRQIIKYYFKSRECLTMVRPTNQECDLQNLDILQDEKLRPDFLAQIISLRKKIFSNCRPKTFNGIKLNSQSYLNIIKDYIEVMNSGKLPSIDSTWNNLCRYESQKALSEAEKIYEEFLKENSKKLLDEKELEAVHSKAKELSMELFRRKSLGDVSNELKKSLKKSLNEKLQIFSSAHEGEIKGELFNFMKNGFQKIEQKLKKNEINSMDKLENEILNIENACVDNFPNAKIRLEMILDFKYKTILSASKFIINNLLNEKNFIFENFQAEKINFLNEKEKFDKEILVKNEEIKKKENDFVCLKEELKLMKEKYLIYEDHKENLANSCEEKVKKIREENNLIAQKLNEKYALKDKEFMESERKLYEIKEKYEREKAEMIVKMGYLNNHIEEMEQKSKENSTNDDIMKFKEEINNNKNIINNLETRIKEINKLNGILSEKLNDYENKLFEKDNKFEAEKNRYEDYLTKIKSEKNENIEKFKELKCNHEENTGKLIKEIDTKNKEIANLENILKKKNEENENNLKELKENSKTFTKKAEKDLAVEKQENQFLQIKCNELMKQIEENKTSNEIMLGNFEKKMQQEILLQKEKMNQIKKSEIEAEKKTIEENFLKEKIFLKKENENIQEKFNKKDLINKKLIEDFEGKIKEENKFIEKLKNEILSLKEIKKKLEEEKMQQNEENNLKFKKFMSEFEKKMEEKEAFYKNDLEIVNKNSEEKIGNYKLMFEEEKNQLEEIRKEEKIKYKKKLKIIQEENDAKISDMENEFKNDLENLKEENEEMEENSKSYMIEAENQIMILNQKLITAEANLKENKEILATFQAQFNNSLEKKNENFNTERNEFLKKIENLQNELNAKEQDYTNLVFKIDTLQKNNTELSNFIQKEKKTNEDNKNEFLSKNEIFKNKNQELADDLNKTKLEQIREINLLKQQMEFLNDKNEELINKNKENNLANTKKELEAEYTKKIENLRKEKEDFNNKLTQKKKEYRELEQAMIKQNYKNEKESGEFKEKIANMEQTMKEICENYKNELDKISEYMNTCKEEADIKETKLNSLIENLRMKNSELEKESKLNKKKNNDKKKKMNLMEQVIEENKKSMQELQVKFEEILLSAIDKEKNEKEKIENDYKEKLLIFENQYMNSIRKIEEENNYKILEIARENKELEDELSNLSRQTVNSIKQNDPRILSNKIQELLTIQGNLRKEKEEKEKKIIELLTQNDREKEMFNIKLIELEIKLKNFSNNNMDYYENYNYNSNNSNRNQYRKDDIYEKERKSWRSEKENLIGTIDNLKLLMSKIEKKNEYINIDQEQMKYSSNNNNNNYDTYNEKRGQTSSSKSLVFVNDKEILMDNYQKNSGNFNLNINSENSPQKYSKNYFRSNSNVMGKNINDYQNIGDVLSPVIANENGNKRKDTFINEIRPNFSNKHK